MWSNFWGDVRNDGFYARSSDYLDIARNVKKGLWNSPWVKLATIVNRIYIWSKRVINIPKFSNISGLFSQWINLYAEFTESFLQLLARHNQALLLVTCSKIVSILFCDNNYYSSIIHVLCQQFHIILGINNREWFVSLPYHGSGGMENPCTYLIITVKAVLMVLNSEIFVWRYVTLNI